MRRSLRTQLVAVGSAALFAACGGDDGGSISGEADGTMSALISDGDHWSASKSVVATLRSGELVLTGTEKGGRFVKISVHGVVKDPTNTDAQQQFSLSYVTAFDVGFAQYSETGSDNFSTTITGGSGSVVITHLTDTRVAGTFTFSAVRNGPPPATGPGMEDLFRRLSGGQFDVRLQ